MQDPAEQQAYQAAADARRNGRLTLILFVGFMAALALAGFVVNVVIQSFR